MLDKYFLAVNPLNQNKIFIGVSMLLLNLGSRFLVEELSESQEDLFNNKVFRRIVLFCVIFIATKDIRTSLLLTAAFIIFVQGLFNENSKYCIMRKSTFTNRGISKEEYNKAKQVVTRYEKQQQKKNKK
jgi:uncharacterized protein YqgQ